MSEETFEILFKLYYDKLLIFANSYLKNDNDAQEIVQNTFVKVWQGRSQITENLNINAYLYKIVRNGCLDFLKHEKVKLNYQNNYKQIQASINYEALIDEASSDLIRQELNSQILKAIDYLPPSCKSIFIKSKIEGKKNKEIAEELQLSIRTVENQILKSTKIVRKKLKHVYKAQLTSIMV